MAHIRACLLTVPLCSRQLFMCIVQGLMGGDQGVVDMLKDDTVRYVLESGGFVLAEVLEDAGYNELKVTSLPHMLSLQQSRYEVQ
jgi:hypothetical protein